MYIYIYMYCITVYYNVYDNPSAGHWALIAYAVHYYTRTHRPIQQKQGRWLHLESLPIEVTNLNPMISGPYTGRYAHAYILLCILLSDIKCNYK